MKTFVTALKLSLITKEKNECLIWQNWTPALQSILSSAAAAQIWILSCLHNLLPLSLSGSWSEACVWFAPRQQQQTFKCWTSPLCSSCSSAADLGKRSRKRKATSRKCHFLSAWINTSAVVLLSGRTAKRTKPNKNCKLQKEWERKSQQAAGHLFGNS